MKQYINTSNYYLWTLASVINETSETGTFEVDSVENEHCTLPEVWYYWLDVDFQTSWEREIFRIVSRVWNTLTYDKRISPTWKFRHELWAVVWLRDFAELFNSLSSNVDNFWQVEQVSNVQIKVFWWNIFVQWWLNRNISTRTLTVTPNNWIQYLHFDSSADAWNEYVFKNNQDPYLFLLAWITTDTSSITWIEDLRWLFIGSDLWFLRLDGSTPMEWDLNMNWHKILNTHISWTPVIEWATWDTIAWFDSTKHLISLNVNTYPNLTELSYLKWVTSNIQQQIDDAWDMKYDDYHFSAYPSAITYTINDLSMNISCDHDIRFNAWANLKEWQQYIARVANTDNIEHMLIFNSWISWATWYLILAPNRVTLVTMLATSPSTLERQAQTWVTSVNGQTWDVIIDLSSALEQQEESWVWDLVRDTNLWELTPWTYQVWANEILWQPYPVRLFYREWQYFEAWFGCTVSISYNQTLTSNLWNYYTILSWWFIHYWYANQVKWTYRKVYLHQNDPVELTYAYNLDIDLNQSLNYTLTLTWDCYLTFGQEQWHAWFTNWCVYQIILIQDSVWWHRIHLPNWFLYASWYAQDTTAWWISKLIVDEQHWMYFASISRYS